MDVRRGAPGEVGEGIVGRCLALAAPLATPLLAGARGDLYAITLDAYLHVYDAELRHRFSFSLEGTPVAALPLRDGVLVASASRRFSGVSDRGVERIHFHSLARPLFGMTRTPDGKVLFVGADRFVYAMSETGRSHYRVELPEEPTGAPVVDASGRPWVPLRVGLARLDGARAPLVVRTEAPVTALRRASNGLWVVTGDRLASLDADGRLASVARGGEVLVTEGRAFVRGQSDRVGVFEGVGRRELRIDAGASLVGATENWLLWRRGNALHGEELRSGSRHRWEDLDEGLEFQEFGGNLFGTGSRTQRVCRLEAFLREPRSGAPRAAAAASSADE